MSVLWGLIIAAIGVLFIVWGQTRSEFVLYRPIVARSRLLWGDRVYAFHQVSGVLMIIVGALFAILG